MKKLALILLLTTITVSAQQMTLTQWNEEAKTNIRLLPKYGNAEKTPTQKQADEEFIAETMKQSKFNGDRTAASHHMIGLGFNYLGKGDIKTAMYRFNQAYLLDNTNADIYWGYGAVYMTLGDSERGKQQYEGGLVINPNNTHLLTDMGSYYLGKYYNETDEKKAPEYLETGLTYLQTSYKLDPKDQDTVYKLSVSYWIKGDCKNAKKFYNECEALGGRPITKDYTEDLLKTCGK